jgi:hypothetical protein
MNNTSDGTKTDVKEIVYDGVLDQQWDKYYVPGGCIRTAATQYLSTRLEIYVFNLVHRQCSVGIIVIIVAYSNADSSCTQLFH